MKLSLYILLFLFGTYCALGQNNTAIFNIQNQPQGNLIFGIVEGDQYKVLDSINHTNGQAQVVFDNNFRFGVYRLILGQTPVAEIMQEPPQQLDFVYNGEDIEIVTDFNSPLDSTKVIKSTENQVWYSFLKKDEVYQKKKKELEIQINYFQNTPNDAYYTTQKQTNIINHYNHIQRERNGLIATIEKDYPQLFATKLIRIQQEPFIDGSLTTQERKSIHKSQYFNGTNFSDELLMNSSVYSDKVFKYLMLYARKGLSKQKQEEEFKNAIDVILDKTKANPNVSAFIVDYLMRGFEKLGLDNLQAYISETYLMPHGCSNDNSTLERRLAFQKMKIGDLAPDFSLSAFGGGHINLFSSDSDYKLILFWETTCPMCKEMLPQLRSWYFSKEIDLEIFAVSIDKDQDIWQDFVSEADYPWINLNEHHGWNGKVATAYNLYATPTMFLLNSENKIVAKPYDFSDFLEAISNLY